MTEKAMWEELEYWAELNTILMDRIESPITKGLPDVYFTSSKGFTGWIELKIGKLKKRTCTVEVPYREGQQGWLKKHKLFHANVFVLVWFAEEYFLFNRYFERHIKTTEMYQWSIWTGFIFDPLLKDILYGRKAF